MGRVGYDGVQRQSDGGTKRTGTVPENGTKKKKKKRNQQPHFRFNIIHRLRPG